MIALGRQTLQARILGLACGVRASSTDSASHCANHALLQRRKARSIRVAKFDEFHCRRIKWHGGEVLMKKGCEMVGSEPRGD